MKATVPCLKRFRSTSWCPVRRTQQESRHGTTVVETALVLPVFLVFVLAIIELGHAQMVKNLLRSGCREAARVGSTEGHSTSEVRQRVLNVIGAAVEPELVEVFVKNASVFDGAGGSTSGTSLESLPNVELLDAPPRSMFLVRAKVRYHDIAIVPNIPFLGNFLDDVVLEGQSFMRHE